MAKQACTSDADGKPVDRKVFISTNLQTRLAVTVSCADTVCELQNKIQHEHPLCFPDVGKIKIVALKVKFRGDFYHLPQSMFLRIAFDGICKNSWFAYADVSVLPHDTPIHHFLLPDSNVKNTVVSHPQRDHPTSLSNFDKGAEPSTYDHDQIMLDISSPEKQGHSGINYDVAGVGIRCEAEESGRGMNDLQLKVVVEETAHTVSIDKKKQKKQKKRKMKHIDNSSGNLHEETRQVYTSSTQGNAVTVADDNDTKREALRWENTHNVDGDVEENSHVKASNIGEEVRAPADENNIIDHCQEVGTYNANGAEEGNKIVHKQDSKSIMLEVIKPSDEYDSDVRMNQTSVFSKNSDTPMIIEHESFHGRRKKKKTEDPSGAMLDGTIEGCMSKGEGVLTELGNFGDLNQLSETSDKPKEFFPERQENVISREVNPAEDKGKGAANQKGNVYEKDGGLEQLSEAQEIAEKKDKKKKSKRCRSIEFKIPDNLRKDGRSGDNSSEGHHSRSLVGASKSKTIIDENRSRNVEASKPKMDQKLQAILISNSNLEASTKLPCNQECQNLQLSLDKYNPTKIAAGSVFGPSHTGQKRSLLASSGPIFKDDSSDSLEEDQSYRFNRSTRTPSENSLSSAYTDGESNADSLIGKSQENGESLARADLSDKKAMTIENVLRSSKRYKKAKLIASQMESTEKNLPGFIPDSKVDS